AEVAAAGATYGVVDRRHHRRDDGGADALGADPVGGEERAVEHAELVGGGVRVGAAAPVLVEVGTLVEAEHGVGVADVDDEQLGALGHGRGGPRMAGRWGGERRADQASGTSSPATKRDEASSPSQCTS